MNEPLPDRGRLAGIDYGHVRIGIALCDPDHTFASPWDTYTRRSEKLDAEYFRKLVDQERVVGLVVGLPVHASSHESAKSREAREFGRWLADVTQRPVQFFDERYTTVEAEKLLLQAELGKKHRKRKLDGLAAQILLTAYLESPQAANEPPRPLEDA
jgi:putative Holliday junction resolvase